MKKYEVTYHLTNGEIKDAFTFFADESIENVVNINYVCFLEVKEVK